jgi:hypothetical protein
MDLFTSKISINIYTKIYLAKEVFGNNRGFSLFEDNLIG